MSAPVRLWLFDIDGTLVDTGGAGLRALERAARDCFGGAAPVLDLRGATDSGILGDLYRHYDREPEEALAEAFFGRYLEVLGENLRDSNYASRVLPGVVEILGRLAAVDEISVGLLTGNIEAGARAKMSHFGLDHHFAFGAFGCDHADRNQLGPIALERAAAHAGRSFTPEETLVIGDTPKDIACARAIGARCLAVATGAVPAGQLEGADHVLDSLEQREVWEAFLG